MTEIDIGSLNLDEDSHQNHEQCDHSHIKQSAKPKLITAFDNHSKSQFSQRLTVNDLPILSVVSPMKLNAVTVADDQSTKQSAITDLLKLAMHCQSERSQVYAVFESAFAGYIETVQSVNQSNNQGLSSSEDESLQKVLVEQALRDYTQLCQRIIVLFKHCSLNIKSIINSLAAVSEELANQSDDQSNNQSTSEDIKRIVSQLQQLQTFEQSKLALTIQRQDASSQFIVSMKQPYHADYIALMDETRVNLGEVIVEINDILDDIREFIYQE